MKKIFIQIPAYKDSELFQTIKDLLKKSSQNNELNISICAQGYTKNEIEELKYIGCKVIDIPPDKTRGVCFARNLLQNLYNGEDYCLQIDSHMRFEKDWDKTLINMLTNIDDKKALLSSYPPPYYINQPIEYASPYISTPVSFEKDGMIKLLGNIVVKSNEPILGAFLSGGFIFSYPQFINDVLYDPSIYFNGEEITISARAYTYGWNIYHPHVTTCYHLYNRKEFPKHWKDFEDKAKEYNKVSNFRVLQLLSGNYNNFGIYGFGTIRSFNDFQKFCGIDFNNKIISKNAKNGIFNIVK